MYRLYANIAGKKLLDVSENEKDIIDTMGEYLKTNKELHFSIVKQNGKKDTPVLKGVWGIQGYIEYLEDYKIRLKTCTELKDEITKIKSLQKK